MNLVRKVWHDHLRLWRPLLLVHAAAALAPLILFLVWLSGDVPLGDLTRDPVSVVEVRFMALDQVRAALGGRVQHPNAAPPLDAPAMEAFNAIDLLVQPYYGLISNFGVIFWCSAMAVALFAGLLLRRSGREGAAFFFAGATLTFLLMLDDFFLIHERVLPIYFGLDERALFALYGLLMLAYLAIWHRRILAGDYLLLFYGLGFFALSLVVDLLPIPLPQPHFFEDGFKFIGIVGWTTWHWRTATQALSPQP